ncbi:unnamed protein product [Penicillium salamii]|nr:unnamed protein product [Penicillium salamii]
MEPEPQRSAREPPSFPPFQLSPLDHLMPSIYVTGFTSFATSDQERSVSALHESIHRLIQQRPPLGGEVVVSNTKTKTNIRKIQPVSSSQWQTSPIVRTKYDSLKSISCIANPDLCNAEFRNIPCSQETRRAFPVMRFQANVMCDGIILATTFFHQAMDGGGYFNILRELATLTQGLDYSTAISSQQEEQARRSLYQLQLQDGQPRSTDSLTKSVDIPVSPINRQFLLSTTRLRKLHQMCQEQIDCQDTPENEPSPKVSSGDVECAAIWLCVARARIKAEFSSSENHTTSKRSSFATAINTRSTVVPQIPQSYLGNAIVFATASYDVPSMIKTTGSRWISLMADLAIRVQRSRRGVDKSDVDKLVSCINETQDWGELAFQVPEVLVSNMRHMKVYELDFGKTLGLVHGFEMHNTGVRGGCWIMPDLQTDHGNIAHRKLSLGIEPEAMVHFEGDSIIQWLLEKRTSKL